MEILSACSRSLRPLVLFLYISSVWIYWHPNHKCIDINHISRDMEWSDRTRLRCFDLPLLYIYAPACSTLSGATNKSHKENVSTSQFIWNICIESIKYAVCVRFEDARETHRHYTTTNTYDCQCAAVSITHHQDNFAWALHSTRTALMNKMNGNNFKFYIIIIV